MVGGDRAAFDHVEEVLHAIGPKVTYIGPNGHAILTKVAINLALVVSVTAFAEAVALVEKAGVDRAAVVDAALKSVIASPVIGYRAPLLVDDNAVFADVELQQKDLVLAQELARRLGAAVPTCSAASEMLSAGAQPAAGTATSWSACTRSTAGSGGCDDAPSRAATARSTTSRSSRTCARTRAGSTCRSSSSSTSARPGSRPGRRPHRAAARRPARPARAPERRRVPGGDVGARRDPHQHRAASRRRPAT